MKNPEATKIGFRMESLSQNHILASSSFIKPLDSPRVQGKLVLRRSSAAIFRPDISEGRGLWEAPSLEDVKLRKECYSGCHHRVQRAWERRPLWGLISYLLVLVKYPEWKTLFVRHSKIPGFLNNLIKNFRYPSRIVLRTPYSDFKSWTWQQVD